MDTGNAGAGWRRGGTRGPDLEVRRGRGRPPHRRPPTGVRPTTESCTPRLARWYMNTPNLVWKRPIRARAAGSPPGMPWGGKTRVLKLRIERNRHGKTVNIYCFGP